MTAIRRLAEIPAADIAGSLGDSNVSFVVRSGEAATACRSKGRFAPDLSVRASRIDPGGPQRLPTRAAPSLVRALRVARGSPPWTPGTTAPQPPVWVPIARCSRVPLPR